MLGSEEVTKKFECQKCGACCRGHLINIGFSDVQRWSSQKRGDILNKVAFIEPLDTYRLAFAETVPKDSVCPFLSKEDICLIHDTKPRVCKNFPFAAPPESLEMCEGIKKGYVIDYICRVNSIGANSADNFDVKRHHDQILAVLLAARKT